MPNDTETRESLVPVTSVKKLDLMKSWLHFWSSQITLWWAWKIMRPRRPGAHLRSKVLWGCVRIYMYDNKGPRCTIPTCGCRRKPRDI